jgi:sugar phosphate isomerase/epimerase
MSHNSIDIGYCWDFSDIAPDVGLERLHSYKFDGVELWPNRIPHFSADEWAMILKSNSMRCLQLCPYFDFVHGAKELAASRAEFDRTLEYAKVLDCHKIRVFTGPLSDNLAVGRADATEENWATAIAALQEYCDLAAPHGVGLCLECHPGTLMEDSVGALRLIDGVKRPNLSTNLQLPLLDEDWQYTVRQLGPYTTHIHMHNWLEGMAMRDITYISEGWFDWIPVLTELVINQHRSICISVEHSTHGGRHESWQTALNDGGFMAKLRERVLSGQ